MVVYPPIPAGLSREKHVARLSLKSRYQTILPRNIRDRARLLNNFPDRCFSKFRRKLSTLT